MSVLVKFTLHQRQEILLTPIWVLAVGNSLVQRKIRLQNNFYSELRYFSIFCLLFTFISKHPAQIRSKKAETEK